MERKTAIKGYRVVYGLSHLMRISYFRYGYMYPHYSHWLARLFLVPGNGFQHDGKLWYCYHTHNAILRAKGQRIPEEWFTRESPKPIPLYPFVYPEHTLLGAIQRGEIPLNYEVRQYLEDLLTYLTTAETRMMFEGELDTKAETIEFIQGVLNA